MDYFRGTLWHKLERYCLLTLFCFESCLIFLWINIVNNLKLVAGFTFISFSLRLARNTTNVKGSQWIRGKESSWKWVLKFALHPIGFLAGKRKNPNNSISSQQTGALFIRFKGLSEVHFRLAQVSSRSVKVALGSNLQSKVRRESLKLWPLITRLQFIRLNWNLERL